MDQQLLQITYKSFTQTIVGLFMIFFLFGLSNSIAQVIINPNGGFEASAVTVGDDTSAVEGWDFDVGELASVQIVDDVVLEGSRALKITVDDTGENAWNIQIINESFLLEPGVTYEYSVWANASEGGASAHFTAGNPGFDEFLRIEQNEGLSEGWQNISGQFTVPAGDTVGRAPIHFNFEENIANSIYIDGLTITKSHANDNGSFEASDITAGGDTSGVRGWDFSIGDNADATFEIVDEPVLDGSRALAVTVNEIGGNAWHIEAAASTFDMIPGETYEYSVWARASDDNATVHLTVGGFEEQGYPEYLRFEQNELLTTEWQHFSTQFTTAGDSAAARAPIHFNFSENIGKTIYIDSLRVTQLTGTVEEQRKLPIIVDAESGELGNEWEIVEGDETTYIVITTDFNETTGASSYPGENRTASYSVTFPEVGEYDLFARVRVGPQDFDDDSFFEPHGFGVKDPSNPDDWFNVNGLAAAGFNEPNAVVREEPGGLGSEIWKWVNVTRNAFQGDTTQTFNVEGGLTKTFQIGAREDGQEIDKFAFGRSELFFTVANLDNIEPGSDTDPREAPITTIPIAEGKQKFLGNIYSSSQIQDFTNYWNQVTPENAGKWGSVEGTRDQMNWGSLDAAYDLAKDNGFPFRFHVLVWGNQQPPWMVELADNTEEQLAEITEWFEAVAERYPDIDYLEVVNEPLHDPPDADPNNSGAGNYIEALGGTGDTGWDWVITAFEMARDIFPESTKLMINDYNIINNTNNTNTYRQIINLLIDRDLIDAIGVQGHAFSTRGPVNTIEDNLNFLAETGLPIQITEMDIDGDPEGSMEQSDQVQLDDFQRVFPVLWEHEAVEGITFWGWRPGLWRQQEEAYLVRNTGEERPALVWLREYVESTDLGVSIEENNDGLPVSFRLYNNYPNPFNPTTKIKYDIAQASDVSIKVYDILGRQIQTLVDAQQNPGTYTISFNASRLSSGVYFYRIQTDSFVDVKQMMLVK